MAKYLDNVVFNSKTQGVQETLKVRDTEARAQIQTNANAIADVTVKEAQDRVNIANNAKEIESLHKDVKRIDAKDGVQDLRLDAIEKLDEEQNTRLTNIEAVNEEQNSRLDEAEKDIIQLEDRMDTAEDDIDSLEDRVTTAEGNIQSLDDRVTIAEDDIDTLETRADNVDKEIEDIKAKDAEQDAKLDDLDERVAASTYEAGEGIYFGQGVVHTSINVEDELLEQINQNTTDIKELRETKTEIYREKNDGSRINYPEIKLGNSISVTSRDGAIVMDTQSYRIDLTITGDFDTIKSDGVAKDLDAYLKATHYPDDNVSVSGSHFPYGTPLMMRITRPSGIDYRSFSPCITSNRVGNDYPCTVTTFTRDESGKPCKIDVLVPSSTATQDEITITVTFLATSTDIEAINQKILDLTNRVTAVEGTVDEHESMIQSILSDVEDLGTKVQTNTTNIQTNTTNITNLTTRVSKNETNITRLQSDKLDKFYGRPEAITVTNFASGGNLWTMNTPSIISVTSSTQNKPSGMVNGKYFMVRFGYKDLNYDDNPDMYGTMYTVILYPTSSSTTPASNPTGFWFGYYISTVEGAFNVTWKHAQTREIYTLLESMDVFNLPRGLYTTPYQNIHPVNAPDDISVKKVYVEDFGVICEDIRGPLYIGNSVTGKWFKLGAPEPVYINATATNQYLSGLTLIDSDKVKELLNTKYTSTDSIPQVYLKIKISSYYYVIPMSYRAELAGDIEPYFEYEYRGALTGLYIQNGSGSNTGEPNVYLVKIFTRDVGTDPPTTNPTPVITAKSIG